jgi:hypothetical protein
MEVKSFIILVAGCLKHPQAITTDCFSAEKSKFAEKTQKYLTLETYSVHD